MEMINLKKGLFGYTKNSVRECFASLNAEWQKRNEELSDKCARMEEEAKKQMEEREAFSGKLEEAIEEKKILSEEIEKLHEEVAALQKELEEAKQDKTDYKKGQDELADVMLEAKRFAGELKQQAEEEYRQKQAENVTKINSEKERIESYIDNVDELCSELRKLCNSFGAEIKNSKASLSFILKNYDRMLEKNTEDIKPATGK